VYCYNEMNPEGGINVIVFLLPSMQVSLTEERNLSLASQRTLLHLSYEWEANSSQNTNEHNS